MRSDERETTNEIRRSMQLDSTWNLNLEGITHLFEGLVE